MKALHCVALILGSLLGFAAGTAMADYKVVSGGVKNGGTVSGRVTLSGPAPAPVMLKVDEDKEACGGDRPSDELLVGAGGGVQNVVLSIADVSSGKDWDFPDKFVYDQKKCMFVPRIMLIKPNAPGEVLNSDSIGHNFHTISKGVYNINKKIEPGSKLVVTSSNIRRAGMVRAKCDIHSWMGGWWVVAETPYTVLTDKDGNFTLKDVPAGSYTLKVWHEKLGETEQKIVVKAGETTKANVSMKP